MPIAPPCFFDYLNSAGTAARNTLAQVPEYMVSALQGIRQPEVPKVLEVTHVTKRGRESWYMPVRRQAHVALLMLLLTPREVLHPRMHSALLTIVLTRLQHLSGTAAPPAVIKAMSEALRTGWPVEKAYLSVLTPAQRDAVWQGGPYCGGDPASDLLLNCLALTQGKVIEMACKDSKPGYTDYLKLPEQFEQKQNSLEERLRQIKPEELTSEELENYLQLNQWLHCQEWLVQLPVSAAQKISHWLLRHWLPSTAVARQLINYCQGQVSAQALGEDWQTILSQLKQASTLSEGLEVINKALEQGVLTPVTVLYGLSNLYSMGGSLIPVSLVVGAMFGWCEEKFAGWLREYFGSPSSETPRTLQELGRLAGNLKSLNQYAQPALTSLDEWVNPAPVPEQGDAQRGHDLPPDVTEPPATSAGARPGGILQSAQHGARYIVSSAVRLLWKNEREQTDVETPLYTAPGAVYQTTTEPIAEASQHWLAPVAALGTVAAGAVILTGAHALRQDMKPIGPDMDLPASEPVFAQYPPPVQALLDKLKNHWHLTPEGELMSTLQALMATRAAADATTLLARVSAQLHQDFGESLAPLLDLATPAADADFGEFDALEEIVPVRQRRAAGTGLQAAERVLAEDVIALLDQASSGAQQQDQWLQQEVLRELLSSLPPGHWLHNASAGEQALWLTTTQTLDEGYQRLANLKYDSLAQFEAQRPALQQALAEVNQNELQLAVLKSRLKGDLSPGGSYMDGLAVVMAALNNDPRVAVGSLRLAIGKGADAVSVPLAQWQVFVRRDARGKEDGVVLYRPAERRVQAFSSQQEMFQHLDLKRMQQSLHAEVRPPATPGPATSRPAAPTAPAPKGLPELALENALPAQRPALRRTLDERGRRADLWASGDFQLHTYPGASLQDKLGHRAGVLLDSEQARLQRLAASPQLATQMAAAARTEQEYRAFVDENLPTLRAFTRRTETRKLTEVLQGKGGLAANATVDADAVRITFNGQTMNWTDWVLEGYRRHGDNVFAISNNFLADARFEHDDPAVVQALGTVKQDVQHHLRSTYAGNQYIEYLKQWLAPNDLRGQAFAQLRSTLIQQQLQVTLEQARVDGTLDPYTAGEFRTLVDGLRTVTVTDTGKASLQALQVNGLRIPEVLVLSLRQRAQEQRSAAAQRSDYVYLQGPYGPELLKLSDYQQLISTSGAYYDDLQARALLEDKIKVEQAQRDQRNTRVSSVPIDDFCRDVDQWLWDGIKNANEASTSRKEMILDQFFKGVGGAAGVTCMAGSLGIATVPCAALTLGLIGHDAASALHHLEHGRLDDALMDVAFLTLDVLDMGPGLRALKLDGLLDWAGKLRFSSATELSQAVQAMARQRDKAFTPLGQLNDALARSDVTREQLTALSPRPGKADAGTFYSHDGKHYILNRYQDQVLAYEVYSDNGWATVRVRDPQRPQEQGAPVHYRDGHWRADEGGLLGGGGGSSSLRSNEEWEEYLHMFDFDHTTDNDRYRELEQAFHNGYPPPDWIFKHLRNRKDGWRAYGLLGWKPIHSVKTNYDPASIKQMLARFDFSTAPTGHVLGDWLLHDRFNLDFWQAFKEEDDWPSWAIKYAKKDTILDFYTPTQVLSDDKKTFPRKDVLDAYLREFDVLDETSRSNLIENRVRGHDNPDLIMQFPEHARVSAKIQALVNPSDFADENAVVAYLDKFAFPDTDDGQILRMALLSDRIKGGRTPAWAGYLVKLESWQQYKRSTWYSALEHQNKLDTVLVEEGGFSQSEAATYTSSFKTIDADRYVDQDLREELVLSKILEPDRPPVWAFMDAKPATRMIIYKSQHIPANLERFEVTLGGVGCEQNLVLPENMPNLKTVKIEGVRNSNLFKVTLPSQMAEVEFLQVKRVQLQQEPFQLDDLFAMRELSIEGCSGTQEIQLGAMPNLKTLKLTDNAQLSQLKMPDEWPRLEILIISRNPHLQPQALQYPQALPALHSLHLEHNDLVELSFLQRSAMPELRSLELSGNQLRHLEHVPQFPQLTLLGLRNNRFVRLPHYIQALPNTVSVDLVGNTDFNPRIQRYYETLMTTEGYTGPRVQFAIAENDLSPRNAPPLAKAVSAWFPVEQQEEVTRLWSPHDGEDNASLFSAFLVKLLLSPSDIAVFKNEVPTWLNKLRTDDKLRLKTFMNAYDATASCHDRVSLTYNQMQELALRFDVINGRFNASPNNVKSALRQLFRLELLDKWAEGFISRKPSADEVEVFLALREKLGDKLGLPGNTSKMLFENSSDLTEPDYNQALAYVLAKEAQGLFDTYLVKSEVMRAVLERKLPVKYEQAKEQLTVLVGNPDTGRYAEIRDRILGETKPSLEDQGAMVQIDSAVMDELYKEYYGPLINQFFRPAS
ncbi:NEL-type E3 ubiquitin ligase domain-containing protein [Pseudomonas sp. 65/3-MNA-CIBAN-0223]|uniref:NEL-type E3 ubiquitin ligase domain-containing protein n=1 Tax=Pseudomonas sp. 65/3-MNA-CIBAN-0223 TaxID=3140476 RepID=UPI003317FC30